MSAANSRELAKHEESLFPNPYPSAVKVVSDQAQIANPFTTKVTKVHEGNH
jgi:hypothetical protein